VITRIGYIISFDFLAAPVMFPSTLDDVTHENLVYACLPIVPKFMGQYEDERVEFVRLQVADFTSPKSVSFPIIKMG
jgi:hypothetical protein